MATPDDVTVPPEIVEKAAKAVHDEMGDKCSHDALGDDCRYISRGVLAAVYGDIVEAARQDAEAVHSERRQRHLERITAERDAALRRVAELEARI